MTDETASSARSGEAEQRQAFLLKLTDTLRPLSNPVDIQTAAMKLLAEQFDVMRAGYLDVDVDVDGDLMSMAARFERDAPSTPDRVRLSDYGPELVGAFRAGQTRKVCDASAEAQTEEQRAAYRAIDVQSWIIAPLVKDGHLIAIVGVVEQTPRDWTPVEVEIVTEVAERTWDAVERARSEAALRQSEERQAFLLKLSDALRPLTDGGEIERVATRLLGEHLEADRCFLSPVDEDGTGMCVREEYLRAGASSVLGDYTFAQFGDFVGPALHGGHILAVEDVGALTNLASAERESYDKVGIGAYLLIPLVRDGRLAAFLTINHRTAHRWGDADKAVARQTADRLWTARERARVETALRESETRYRLLFDAIDEGFCLVERVPGEPIDYRYVAVNRAFHRQSGLDHPIGRTIRDLVPGIEEPIMEAYARVEATGTPEHFTWCVSELGRWFDVEAIPTDGPGQIAALFRDVTDRVRAEAALSASEKRLQNLVEGVPQLVWRAVDGGRWTWASPQWTMFTGQCEADSHGLGWLEPVHPDDRDRLVATWKGAAERGEFHADFRLCHAGERRYAWFQSRATAVRDDQGSIVEWLGTSTDIDDLRALQTRQQVLVKELQHRTRNLITVVGALSGQTMKNAASLADFDQRFGQRLAALSRVQGMLSHLSAGRRIAFDELLRSELSGLGALDDRITLDGPVGVPLRSGTVQTFSLALHELATNALKYGALGDQGGHLTVRWSVNDHSEGRPRLLVDWRESGVVLTLVGDRARGGGYGRELIERALPYQLDADTSYEITADGVHCTMDVPISTAQAEKDDHREHGVA